MLVTTFSMRAAAGFGEARAVAVDLAGNGVASDARSDVVFFDVMPYFASSVLF